MVEVLLYKGVVGSQQHIILYYTLGMIVPAKNGTGIDTHYIHSVQWALTASCNIPRFLLAPAP